MNSWPTAKSLWKGSVSPPSLHAQIKEGALDDEKKRLFEELLATSSNEYTGGRKKRVDN